MPIDAINQARSTQTPINTRLKEENNNVEKPVENKTNQKALIAVGAALALTTLGVLGYKGYLGKGIKKALGGVKKVEEKATEQTKEEVNNRIKTFKNETTRRTHKLEYNEDGTLIKETITEGEDYAIYENVNGKMRIVSVKKGDTISLRRFDENGKISRLKPQVPIKAMPSLMYKEALPQNLTEKEIPNALSKDFLEKWPKGENNFKGYKKDTIQECIDKHEITSNNSSRLIKYDLDGNIIEVEVYRYNSKKQLTHTFNYDKDGKLKNIYTNTYDENGNKILREKFGKTGKLKNFTALRKDGDTSEFDSKGMIIKKSSLD